ncbi:hypothetical protein ASD83_07655 [Devosia sp. Root685]|nr:hypothetical protein ASD83_07655 [Devosia sp. Root685]
MGQVIIAFWTQAEVSSGAWNEENIVDIAGIKFLFAVLRKHRAVFLDAVIDYSPESAFFLRKTPTV